jgi:DNA sulfur modification protein DndE
MNNASPNIRNILEQYNDGVAAYLYGFPLVLLGVTEQGGINSPQTATSGSAPLNQFGQQTKFPDSSFTGVVLPSTSTLYSSAFLNLSAEPVVLHLPDFGNRFFILPLLDGWTNVNPASLGTRYGSQEGDYVLVGPGQAGDGTDYGGRTVIQMNTNTVWIIGRVFTDGTQSDLDTIATEIYPKLTLTPWSKLFDPLYSPPTNLPFDPLVDRIDPPPSQVNAMNASTFFSKMAAMMRNNPALRPQDDAMIHVLEKIGFDFDPEVTVPPTVPPTFPLSAPDQVLESEVDQARAILNTKPESDDSGTNYWNFPTVEYLGNFGIHYYYRAMIAKWALGANLVPDVVYGYSTQDSTSAPLSGANKYTLTFNPLPPVSPKGFWSVTIYNYNGTLVNNNSPGADYSAIGCAGGNFTIQAHTAQPSQDGKSITLYLQPSPPDDPVELANWLPIPNNEELTGKLEFIVFLRMYIPCLEDKVVHGNYVVEGNWLPPGIMLVA